MVEHLGVVIDSRSMRFYTAPGHLRCVNSLARKLFSEVRYSRRGLNKKELAHFCNVCVSLTLAMPWSRFHTRALYWDMSKRGWKDVGRGVRLRHQSMKDLQKWRELSRNELEGHPMVPFTPSAAIHTDAAGVGYGGTLNVQDFRAGVNGPWRSQGTRD